MQNLLKKSLPTIISKIANTGSAVNSVVLPLQITCKSAYNFSVDAKNPTKDAAAAGSTAKPAAPQQQQQQQPQQVQKEQLKQQPSKEPKESKEKATLRENKATQNTAKENKGTAGQSSAAQPNKDQQQSSFALKGGKDKDHHASFDKISSYENLISRISSADSVSEVLKIYSVNESLLKNEHIVLCLRMMARLIRAASQQEIEALPTDERYKSLTQKAVNSLDSFNEYEALDFLFWMRKFRVSKISLNFQYQALEKFHKRINEFLKNKSFNFRNLVNLYYDYSFLNKNCDEICVEILRELKSDIKLLTPFTVIQILQAASRKTQFRSARELVLADYVQRNITTLLDEFDTDQKCVIFKYLSALEMNFNPPRYRIPMVLYTIRSHLKDKLDQLSETSVVNILLAYKSLPREFPIDLLEEIKEMVIVTVQHNSANIKSFFLLDFIEVLQQIRRKRLDEAKSQILADEIANRLPHDDFLSKPRNLERIINVYERGIRSDLLVKTIYGRVANANASKKQQFVPILYEFLAKRKENISPLLDELYKDREGFLSNISPYHAVRLQLVLSYLYSSKNTSSTTPSEQQTQNVGLIQTKLEEKIQALIKTEPGRVINILKSSHINTPKRKDYMLASIKQLQAQFKKGENEQNFFRNMLISTELKEQRTLWIEWLTANEKQFDISSINKFFDVFQQFEQQQQQAYEIDHYMLFFHIIQLDSFQKIALKKLLFILKDHQQFLLEIVKYENIMKKFFIILTTLTDKQPENVRLAYIYTIALRLESLGVRSQLYTRFLKKSYENYKKGSKAQEASPQVEFIFSLLLLNHGVLPVEAAKEIFEKQGKDLQDVNLKSRFFAYIVSHDFPNGQQNQQQIQESPFLKANEKLARELLETLTKNLGTNSSSAGRALQTLTQVLQFPPELIRKESEFYLKSLKDCLSAGVNGTGVNEKIYLQLVNNLVPRYVKMNYELYFPFLKEIINSYQTFHKRLPFADIVRILIKFTQLNCKHPNIYNYILNDIGNNFASMTAEERVKCLEAFSVIKIKQVDFYHKNLEKITENFQNYAAYYNNIVNALYKIGYDNTESIDLVNKLADRVLLQENLDIEDAIAFIRYYPVLGAPKEAEVLGNFFNKLNKDKIKAFDKYRNRQELILFYEFFRRVYAKNPDYADKLKAFFDDAQFTHNFNAFFDKNKALQNSTELIGQYLKSMKIEFQTDQKIDGLPADIVIPAKKIIIKIVQAKDINFDRSSFTGKVLIQKKLYNNLGGNKVVFLNNIEFRSLPDHISRVNLLISEGIDTNNTGGEYDFSHIKQIRQKKEADVEEDEMDADFEGTSGKDQQGLRSGDKFDGKKYESKKGIGRFDQKQRVPKENNKPLATTSGVGAGAGVDDAKKADTKPKSRSPRMKKTDASQQQKKGEEKVQKPVQDAKKTEQTKPETPAKKTDSAKQSESPKKKTESTTKKSEAASTEAKTASPQKPAEENKKN